MNKTIQIDDEGFPKLNELRVQDQGFGKLLLEKLENNNFRFFTTEHEGEKILVEAFDEPYVAQQVHVDNGQWFLLLPYELKLPFSLETLTLDEWDRFHGWTEKQIPFVFSRKAQNEFFNLLDEFDDDSITFQNKKYTIANWLGSKEALDTDAFWTGRYKEHNYSPPWDKGGPAEHLESIVPQLKLPKSRILVLGAGACHDAAWIAQKGHIVTAVDFSDTAIELAQEKYGKIENLSIVKGDIFALPENYKNSFDIIFEHTCYCAIPPEKRNQLIQIWKSCLVEGGHLLGIFFVHPQYDAAPLGGTEWELRERLKKYFRNLYWTRWQGPSTRPKGMELVIYAQKKS